VLELDGIVTVRRPDGSRWNDGAAYRLGVRLVDVDLQAELYEEAAVEDVQSYQRFQCFVAREFGRWYRYPLAENPATGALAWSELVGAVWGRVRGASGDEPPAYFDAAPWVADEDQ
jgi:hypothetical protein